MGVLFLAHPNESRFFACRKCDCPLAEATESNTAGALRDQNRRVILVKKCLNIRTNHTYWRTVESLTPNQMVRDIACVKCNTNLGWLNEFYRDSSQIQREGLFSLLQNSIKLKDEDSQKLERWVEQNVGPMYNDLESSDSDATDFAESDTDDLENYGGAQPNAGNIGQYQRIQFLNSNRNLFRRVNLIPPPRQQPAQQ